MTHRAKNERLGMSPPVTRSDCTSPAAISPAARRVLRLACVVLLAVGIVGCGPGYDKGVNKGLDKPVHADKEPDKQPDKK
jgi:hypothetical protein